MRMSLQRTRERDSSSSSAWGSDAEPFNHSAGGSDYLSLYNRIVRQIVKMHSMSSRVSDSLHSRLSLFKKER